MGELRLRGEHKAPRPGDWESPNADRTRGLQPALFTVAPERLPAGPPGRASQSGRDGRAVLGDRHQQHEGREGTGGCEQEMPTGTSFCPDSTAPAPRPAAHGGSCPRGSLPSTQRKEWGGRGRAAGSRGLSASWPPMCGLPCRRRPSHSGSSPRAVLRSPRQFRDAGTCSETTSLTVIFL